MINSLSVNIDKQNYQMTFGNKISKAEREAYKTIDTLSDTCKYRQRPSAEKMEVARRESASLLVQKVKNSYFGKLVFDNDSYISKLIERGIAAFEHLKQRFGLRKPKNIDYKQYEQYIQKAVQDGTIDADHAGTLLINKKITDKDVNKLIEAIDKAHKQAYLEDLKINNPELYKETIRREGILKASSITNMQLLKGVITSLFKKP